MSVSIFCERGKTEVQVEVFRERYINMPLSILARVWQTLGYFCAHGMDPVALLLAQ